MVPAEDVPFRSCWGNLWPAHLPIDTLDWTVVYRLDIIAPFGPTGNKGQDSNGFPITYGKSLAIRTSYVPPLIRTFLGHFHMLQNEVLITRVDCI